MMPPNLATAKTPPLSLPLRFFVVTGGAIALLQAGLLIWAGPLAGGVFRSGYAVTLAHLFTLGLGSMVSIGALYQLLPVILEHPLSGVDWARRQFGLYVAGVVLLIVGFVPGTGWLPARLAPLKSWLIPIGGTITLGGAWLFVGIALATMRAARHSGKVLSLPAQFIHTALLFFGLTVTWGLLLALNLRFRLFPEAHLPLLIAHAGIGLIGWFGLLVTGVSYVLLPMFYLVDGVAETPARLLRSLLMAGTIALAVSGLLALLPRGLAGLAAVGAGALRYGGTILCALGLLAFLHDQVRIIKRRNRKTIDVTLRYTFASWAALLLAVLTNAAALTGLWRGADRAVLTVAWLGLGGWVLLMIIGQLYKILPFLVWFHRFGDKVGREKVPMLRDMYSPRLADAGWWLNVPGLLLIAVGLALGNAGLVRAGAVLGLAGAGVLIANIRQVLLAGR